MSERIEYASDMQTIVSWLRYEYDGLNLLRIDERYDGETPAGLDENDPWRPLNVFIHGPGAIGQIVKGKWYNYYSDGQDPANCCDSGEYDYFYDALGNVNGVLDDGGHYYRWEMDAFGNDLPGGNAFLPMDQPGPKEHLTGKLFDTTTGLYYFAARWYDPQVGRFVSRDPARDEINLYILSRSCPTSVVDPDGQYNVRAYTYKPGVITFPDPHLGRVRVRLPSVERKVGRILDALSAAPSRNGDGFPCCREDGMWKLGLRHNLFVCEERFHRWAKSWVQDGPILVGGSDVIRDLYNAAGSSLGHGISLDLQNAENIDTLIHELLHEYMGFFTTALNAHGGEFFGLVNCIRAKTQFQLYVFQGIQYTNNPTSKTGCCY